MEDFPDKFVYHGSHKEFEPPVVPRRNIRSKINESGDEEVIFDEVSFHATPYRWIALAYTYNNKKICEIDGKDVYYNMGVDLYEHNNELGIYGIGSLEQSLEQLYGDGGYLYHFDKDKFYYKEGLGNLEVIIQESVDPITVEKVDNPIDELKKAEVKFKFIDLALPENEKYRNYV